MCGWKPLLFPSRVPAVCVPPGARLRLRDIPEDLQRRLDVGAVEEVMFIEQSLEAFTYRDGSVLPTVAKSSCNNSRAASERRC